jgi:hypothetical protein
MLRIQRSSSGPVAFTLSGRIDIEADAEFPENENETRKYGTDRHEFWAQSLNGAFVGSGFHH